MFKLFILPPFRSHEHREELSFESVPIYAHRDIFGRSIRVHDYADQI